MSALSKLLSLAVKKATRDGGEAATRVATRTATRGGREALQRVVRNIPEGVNFAVPRPSFRKVPLNEASPSVRGDILDAVASGRVPQFSESFRKAYGTDPRDADVAGELFEPLSAPSVYEGRVPVGAVIMPETRAVSPSVVDRYAAMPADTMPPVIVRSGPDGYELIEGGHRLSAARKRGDADIPVIDATDLYRADWDDYLAGGDNWMPPANIMSDWESVAPHFEGYAVGGRVDASRCFSRHPMAVRRN